MPVPLLFILVFGAQCDVASVARVVKCRCRVFFVFVSRLRAFCFGGVAVVACSVVFAFPFYEGCDWFRLVPFREACFGLLGVDFTDMCRRCPGVCVPFAYCVSVSFVLHGSGWSAVVYHFVESVFMDDPSAPLAYDFAKMNCKFGR